MKKSYLLGSLIVVLLLFAATGWYIINPSNAEEVKNNIPASGPSYAQAVSVITIEPQEVAISQSLPGRISALRQSQVRPQVNGLITERLFEEGAKVEKGQQLYQIDDARYEAALTSAEADLKSAESTIASTEARAKRYEELVKIDAVSHQEYDDVKADLDQAKAAVAVAQAAVDVAKVNLDYTKVYAPITGRIGRSLVTEGALVTANQVDPMAVITQLDPVYVDMKQASSEAMMIHQAQMEGHKDLEVQIAFGDNNEIQYNHTGSLKFSEVTIDQSTGSVTLRATVPNPEGVLMPGLFVRAEIKIGEKETLLVPQRAAIRKPDGTLGVWIVDQNNKSQPRVIEVSHAYKDKWIVTKGLNDGDRVIVEGYQKVQPGSDVVPSPWKAAFKTDLKIKPHADSHTSDTETKSE